MPSSALLALVRRWEDRGLEPHSIMVLRHGHVVAQGWWAPYRPGGQQLVYSVSKTFTACAVGFAVDEGLLSLADRLVDLFPEAAAHAGPRAAALTLHDVLAMRTGHRTDTLALRGKGLAGFPSAFLAAEPEEDLGWFVYHNGATLMAALAVQRRTGRRLLDYLRPRLLDPVGIGRASWSGADGLDAGFSGLHVATDALARLGELILRDGAWQGAQVLPAGWVASMTATHTDTTQHPETADWQQGYGYQVWRCRHGAVRADGAYGQFAVVAPEQDLVVALTSCTERTQETLDAVWAELLPALADQPLPPDPAAVAGLASALTAARLPAPRSSGPPPGSGPVRFEHVPTEQLPALTGVEVHSGGEPARLVVEEGGRSLEIPLADGGWPQPGDSPFAASGGWVADGVFQARVAALATPHVLALRCTDGRVTGQWNGVPLGYPALSALTLPDA